MFRRPSSRRKSKSEQIELNLVPILDTMVTLIGFLLFTTSFLAIVSVETDLPQIQKSEQTQQIQEKPLQLTLTISDTDTSIWSPFSKIESKTIAHLSDKPNLQAIQHALVDIKKQFPSETTVVLMPSSRLSYETLIGLMDTARSVESKDPSIPHQSLFPKVVFGNLTGELE